MASPGGYRFIDEVCITATSGDGGHGARTFRREKFVPQGGPDGGDGGRGGHVVLEADPNQNTLQSLRYTRFVKAKRGGNGDGSQKNGRSGADRIVPVPVGTLVKDAKTGELLVDLSEPGQREIVCAGGKGGRGNVHFKTSRNRAPEQAEDGQRGEEREFLLELKLLADVGLLGFPNAGKSTLISRLSGAKPKVAAYPFTTLEPKLGVVSVPGQYRTFVMADIPGLIEGAADGAGLGHQFLRHVERCSALLHLLSLDPIEEQVSGELGERFAKINTELERYDPELARRPQLVLLSKADLADPAVVAEARAYFEGLGLEVLSASAVTGAGLKDLVYALANVIDRQGDEP